MFRAIRIRDMLIGLTFAGAAILKAWDSTQTLKLLEYIGSSQPFAATILVALLGIEFSLGARLLLPSPAPGIRWFAVFLLAGFSSLLLYLSADPSAPACGCSGKLS